MYTRTGTGRYGDRIRTANLKILEEIGRRIMGVLKADPLYEASPAGTKWECLRASGLMVYTKPDFNDPKQTEGTPFGHCIEQIERKGWWIRHAGGWSSVVSQISNNLGIYSSAAARRSSSSSSWDLFLI